MSLKREMRAGYVAAVALWALPAKADVLEIGDAGSRWLTAAHGAEAAATAPVAAEEEHFLLLADEGAEADTARSGRYVPAADAAKVGELARRFDLSPALIEALVWQESRWRSDALSPKGARGLGQLMPGTARELGVDADDPHANLEGAARYLRAQLDRFDGDVERALAAYNAGPRRVERAGGIPRIAETQNYVAAIMGRLSNHSRE